MRSKVSRKRKFVNKRFERKYLTERPALEIDKLVKIKGQYLQGVFVLQIALFFACIGAYNQYMGNATDKYDSVDGTITSSEVVFELIKFGKFAPEVTYDYTVNGKKLTGHVIGYPTPSYNYRSYAASELYPFPVGRKVHVYYNPSNPSDSVLKKHAQSLLPLYGCAGFAAICGFLLLFCKLPKRKDYDYVSKKHLPNWLYERIKYEDDSTAANS